MIKLIRTAQVASGKGPHAVMFAQDIINVANDVMGTDFQVYTQLGGTVGKVSWVGDFDDMAAMEAAIAKLNSSEEYIQMGIEGSHFWVEGSIHDTILVSLQ